MFRRHCNDVGIVGSEVQLLKRRKSKGCLSYVDEKSRIMEGEGVARNGNSEEPAGVVAHKKPQLRSSLISWAERASSIVKTQDMIELGFSLHDSAVATSTKRGNRNPLEHHLYRLAAGCLGLTSAFHGICASKFQSCIASTRDVIHCAP